MTVMLMLNKHLTEESMLVKSFDGLDNLTFDMVAFLN